MGHTAAYGRPSHLDSRVTGATAGIGIWRLHCWLQIRRIITFISNCLQGCSWAVVGLLASTYLDLCYIGDLARFPNPMPALSVFEPSSSLRVGIVAQGTQCTIPGTVDLNSSKLPRFSLVFSYNLYAHKSLYPAKNTLASSCTDSNPPLPGF